ncbi:hypothetical protein ACFSL6_21980 [Paenibacillus thailandensis]|uniref:Uncharacterized protein n=1 Tax=Paenibacillus thailandensis TaxID=393250 RepID=A0ABW5R4K4_9BACL
MKERGAVRHAILSVGLPGGRRNRIDPMKPILFTLAITAYLCSVFFPGALWSSIVSALSLAVIAAVFRSVTGFVKAAGTVFLTIGGFLLAVGGASLQEALLSFGYMLNVLSLFALVPLIAIPLRLGKYERGVQAMIRSRVRHSGALYAVTSSLSYMFCAFMNLAALPMVHQTIRPSLELYPIQDRDRFVSRAITHGYSMPVLWSPLAPIMGIVVEMTGVRWIDILPVVIPFSLIGLALDIGMGMWIAKRRIIRRANGAGAIGELAEAKDSPVEANGVEERLKLAATQGNRARFADILKSGGAKHPAQIIAAILLFNALISIMEGLTNLGFLMLVSVTVVPFALVWSMLIGQGRQFLKEARKSMPEQLLRMQDQFFVYLSAGFMITAIQTTGAGHVLNEGIAAFKDWIGSEMFLLCIPFIPFVLAFAGLHPAVGLALAAESLDPAALGLPPHLTAIAMLTGATTAFLMGPYNATAGMMAGLIERSPYNVSNWNAPYTAAYMGLSLLLLLILH